MFAARPSNIVFLLLPRPTYHITCRCRFHFCVLPAPNWFASKVDVVALFARAVPLSIRTYINKNVPYAQRNAYIHTLHTPSKIINFLPCLKRVFGKRARIKKKGLTALPRHLARKYETTGNLYKPMEYTGALTPLDGPQ